MSSNGKNHDAVIWCDPQWVGLLRRVLQRMAGAPVVAVGGPDKASANDLASGLGLKPFDDLRRMVVEHRAGYLVLAGQSNLGAAELKAARENGTTVVALEPQVELIAGEDDAAPPVLYIPSLLQCPAWLSAADPMQVIGKPQSLQLMAMAPRGCGSLLSRLYEAMQMLTTLAGIPQSIDASLTGALSEPPEDLRALAGDMTAHLRLADNASAVLYVSDRCADWTRRLTLLGSEGQLFLEDHRYELVNRKGETVDALKCRRRQAQPDLLIAAQWQRHLDGIPPTTRAGDARVVVACCRAALLSCRTGQLESPGTFLRMRTT